MSVRKLILCGLAAWASLLTPASSATAVIKVGNQALIREVSIEHGVLRTVALNNHLTGERLALPAAEEFSLTCSVAGAPPVTLTSADLEMVGSKLSTTNHVQELRVKLKKQGAPLAVEVRYWARENEAWMRKELCITATSDVVIDRIDVEQLAVSDAYQPYRANQLTATGSGPFAVSSPVPGSLRGVNGTCSCGDTITIRLEPQEVRLLDFSRKK